MAFINTKHPDGLSAPAWTDVQLDSWYDTSWKDIDIGIGINSNGNLFTWGSNGSGEVGNGTTVRQRSPVQIGTETNWASVAGYSGNRGAIRSDNTLWVWGSNATGALGDGTTIDKSSPVQVSGSWSIVAFGSGYTAAIKTDGTLWLWGNNDNGQLGDGTVVNKSSPIQIGTNSWSAVAVSLSHVIAIRSNGTLWGWGFNGSGQLGDNTIVSKSSPIQIGTSSWTAVAVGDVVSSAIRSDGALFTWGNNFSGVVGGWLGNGTTADRSSPVQIGTSSWTAVAVNKLPSVVTAAIRSDGIVFTTGYNNTGYIPGLGDGSTVSSRSSFAAIGSTSWKTIRAGTAAFIGRLLDDRAYVWGTSSGIYGDETTGSGTAATPREVTVTASGTSRETFLATRSSDSTLWGWGDNKYGQLGNGTTISSTAGTQSSPVQIGSNGWLSSSIYNGTVYAVSSSGAMWKWGRQNLYLNSADINRSSPTVAYSSDSIGWSAVHISSMHAAAITAYGSVSTWGYNSNGQLGDGTTTSRSGAYAYENPTYWKTWTSWTTVSKRNHALAIRSDGTLWGWGLNDNGQIGDLSIINRVSPVQVSTSSWTAVSVGGTHTVAIRSDGTLWGWGSSGGQIGDGSTVRRTSPVQIGTSSWTKVAAGDVHTLAIRSDGTLWGWGQNQYGRIGDGTTVSKSSPVQIGTSSWTAISSGTQTTLAIKSDGTLWGWGYNGNYNIGDGSTIDKSSPVQIGTSSWIAVASGDSNGYAIRLDGALFAWGLGTSGWLGDGTGVTKSSPVQIGTSSWTAVAIGRAIRSDGALFTWGLGTNGELGDSTASSKSSPVKIGTSSWTIVSSSAAIRTDGTLWGWGFNQYGAVGAGTGNKSSPVFVESALTTPYTKVRAVQLAPGASNSVVVGGQTFALSSNGTLFAWGTNNIGGSSSYSYLGSGDTLNRSSPVVVSGTWRDFETQSTSNTNYNHVGVTTQKYLYVWPGSSLYTSYAPAQLTSNIIEAPKPTLATNNMFTDTYARVWSYTYDAAGGNSSANLLYPAITNIRKVIPRSYDTGYSDPLYDSIVVKNSTDPQTPGAIAIPYNTGTSSVVTGGSHSYLQGSYSPITLGSRYYTYNDLRDLYKTRTIGLYVSGGSGGWGNAGDGTTITRSSPVLIGTSKKFSKISTRRAIADDGTLWAWGVNYYGGLGDGTTLGRSSPVQIGTSSWTVVVSEEWTNTYGIRSDGTLWAWGLNDTGQLGDGTATNKSSPVQIGTSSWTAVGHGIGIKADGSLWTWGSGANGALGDGTTIDKSSPVQIGTSSWVFVTGNANNRAAIRSDGTLWMWGVNTYGRLGDGTTISRSSPVQVVAANGDTLPSSFVHVSVGSEITVAVSSDGRLWSWGTGNSPWYRSAYASRWPNENSNWLYAYVGSGGSGTWVLGVRADGTAWVMGSNGNGQFGDGTTTDKNYLTQVQTEHRWRNGSADSAYDTMILLPD